MMTLENPHNPPPAYDPPIVCDKITEQRDVMVSMRDGKRLCIDIYRPDIDGRFPALLAIAPHNKEYQTPEFAKAAQWRQPAWSRMWFGGAEGGDTDFLVRRGYVHVCSNVRGTGKSDGGGSDEWDFYDLIDRPHGRGRRSARRISDPGVAMRSVLHCGIADSRLFFTAHDSGEIDDIIPAS